MQEFAKSGSPQHQGLAIKKAGGARQPAGSRAPPRQNRDGVDDHEGERVRSRPRQVASNAEGGGAQPSHGASRTAPRRGQGSNRDQHATRRQDSQGKRAARANPHGRSADPDLADDDSFSGY